MRGKKVFMATTTTMMILNFCVFVSSVFFETRSCSRVLEKIQNTKKKELESTEEIQSLAKRERQEKNEYE